MDSCRHGSPDWQILPSRYRLALLLAACDNDDLADFEAGMLGAVEVLVSDYGSIHGRAVALGDPIDSMCSAPGGKAGALEIAADAGNVAGVIGTACSVAAAQASLPDMSEEDCSLVMSYSLVRWFSRSRVAAWVKDY